MKPEKFDSILNQSFMLDCTQITLTQRGSTLDKNEYSGPGVIFQTDDGQFSLKLFCSGRIPISEIFNFQNCHPGKLIDNSQYYSMSAIDINGDQWESEQILPNFSGRVASKGYLIHGHFQKISCKKEILQQLQVHINYLVIRFAGNIKIPCNTGTVLKKYVGEKERESTVNRNVASFMSCGLEFEITADDKWLTISVVSENLITATRILRILEAIQFVLGRSLSWTVIETKQEKSHETIIQPPPNLSYKTRCKPPIASDNINTWNLFDKYLTYCIDFEEYKWHPIFNTIKSVIEATSASHIAEALTVSVAVESLLDIEFKAFYEKYKQKEQYKQEFEDLEKNIDLTKKIIDSSELDPEFKKRVVGLLNGMKNFRAIDILYALNKENLIEEVLIKGWKKLRNRFAHVCQFNWSELQEDINYCNSVTVLFYQLIFLAIGYTGKYTDYSIYGFPTKDFEHKRV